MPELYFATSPSGQLVAMAWADTHDEAVDLIEHALMAEGIVDTDDIRIGHFPRNDGATVIDPEEL